MNIICKELTIDTPKEIIDNLDITNDSKKYYCILCHQIITDQNCQISINESHNHVFANPHGLVFEIGCFTNAMGCEVNQDSSHDFSWFSGYSWSISICKKCQNHNGWFFSSLSHSFFGLILDKIYMN